VEKAVEEALGASPELEQILHRVEAAGEQVRQAQAAFYPRLVLTEDFHGTDNPMYALMDLINQERFRLKMPGGKSTPGGFDPFSNLGRQQNLASRIRGEWSLFEGGRHLHDRRAAAYGRDSVRAELGAARNRLVAKVMEVYFQWLQAIAFIEVAEKAHEAARTDEELAVARLKADTVLPTEVTRMKARTAEVHGDLVSAGTSARKLQAAMERLLARPIVPREIPDPALVASLPFHPTATPVENPVGKALSQRPEVQAVDAVIAAARERMKAETGNIFPKIGSTAHYEWNTEDLSRSVGSWFVGLSATWPLFEGGASVSRIQEARLRLKEMEARGKQVALDIALEVRQAELSLQEAMEKILIADERRKWARQAMEEVRHLYRNEMVTVDALLQSEVSWNRAEVSYVAALFEGKIAYALLRQSMGDFADWVEKEHGNGSFSGK